MEGLDLDWAGLDLKERKSSQVSESQVKIAAAATAAAAGSKSIVLPRIPHVATGAGSAADSWSS